MARYEFKSVFADEIQNYINDKNSAGYNGANFRQNLISFDSLGWFWLAFTNMRNLFILFGFMPRKADKH